MVPEYLECLECTVHMVEVGDYTVGGCMATTVCIGVGMEVVGFTDLLGCMEVECTTVGAPVGGYGMGMGGPYGGQDPNDQYGPPSPTGFWISVLRVMQGVVNFFGRIAILIDQNTQLFYRSGLLYGELARFVLSILGVKTKPKIRPPGLNGFNGPHGPC